MGGVGKDLSTLRPNGSSVMNAAKSSTGAASFMDVDSAITNEVAQNGRRGALMLTLDVRHPDILQFITKKQDLTKVTGANISVKLTDDFMLAVDRDSDYILKFPVEQDLSYFSEEYLASNYGDLIYLEDHKRDNEVFWIKKVRAREIWNALVHCAWNTAEPGIMFSDTHIKFSPDGVYDEFRGVSTNPCGEIFMQPYDSCRLIHLNLTSIVSKAFTEDSSYDTNLLYDIAYMATRLADNLVDLEIEAIDKIINHINSSKGEKRNELELWLKLKNSAIRGRRCGIGFTGLADMLAMLGFPYGGVDSICIVDKIMRVIMKAELDCTIDLAITRGAFLAWDNSIEYPRDRGSNDFYLFLKDQYPERVEIMKYVGRRNISWNTVAPTGTVSLMTGTTSGIEPVFSAYYMRRRKCMNFNDRVDFTDENGEKFTEFPVIHPMFKKWIDYNSDINNTVKIDSIEKLSKEDLESLFKLSPWYGSIASDIDYKDRIAIQSAVQRYTTHSISSTINLPASATEQDVSMIYNAAYNMKLKGITVYRDKCRDGILNAIDTPVENSNNIDFEYYSAPKRPRILHAQLHVLTSGGNKFAVIVGLMNLKPFEVFAYPLTEDDFNVLSNDPNSIKKGHITKVRKGYYKYEDGNYTCDGIQGSSSLNAEMTACTMYISMLLRHRADIKFIIKTAKKVDSNIASFTSAICRVLGKYIPKEVDKNDLCPECGQPLLHEGGCIKCLNCSYSKCMMMIVMK